MHWNTLDLPLLSSVGMKMQVDRRARHWRHRLRKGEAVAIYSIGCHLCPA